MMMNFYVEGRPPGHVDEPLNALDWVTSKTEGLSETTWEDAVRWSRDTTSHLWAESIRTFKYLVGSPLPPMPSKETVASESEEAKSSKKSSAWQLTGMFSSIRSTRSPSSNSDTSSPSQHTEGEVHVDLVRVSQMAFTSNRKA
jgi:mitochondrial import inner membrane translocase subunit TIM21